MELFNNHITIKEDAERAKQRSIFALFNTPNRVNDFSVSAAELFLDYSKQNITQPELNNLISWAKDNKLSEKINAMFRGEKINNTENRAVLHTVLRAPDNIKQAVLGEEAIQVQHTEQRMAKIVDGQNASDPTYQAMSDDFANSIAFKAASALVFCGAEQPSGYTEPLLHQCRLDKKQALANNK